MNKIALRRKIIESRTFATTDQLFEFIIETGAKNFTATYVAELIEEMMSDCSISRTVRIRRAEP